MGEIDAGATGGGNPMGAQLKPADDTQPIDLDAIRERLVKVTPGVWTADGRQHDGGIPTRRCVRAAGYLLCGGIENPEDAVFIAHAPTDLAWCVAEVKRLRADIEGRERGIAAARHDSSERGLQAAWSRVIAERDAARADLRDVMGRLDPEADDFDAAEARKRLDSALACESAWMEVAIAAGCDPEHTYLPMLADELMGWREERDAARAERDQARKACRECLSVIDDCYAATGHIHVAKTSHQRMRIEALAAGLPPREAEGSVNDA